MLNDLCEELRTNGFMVDSFFEDGKHFGNVVMELHSENGVMVSLVKDRGVWDCNVILGRDEIPLVAIVSLLSGTPFEFEDVAFPCDERLVEWLAAHKIALDLLTNQHIPEIKTKWDAITKKRLKNMMG